MTVCHSRKFVANNRPLRRVFSVCAALLAFSLGNSAIGQTPLPNRPTTRLQDRIVSPTYPSPPTQPQAAIPRMRPVGSDIVQVSAEQLKTVKLRPVQNAVETEAATTETTKTDVATTEGSLGPGPDFASQLPEDDSHLIQFIEVMQWTVLVLIIAVVAVIGLKKYGRGNLVAPHNSAISLLATLPVKNFFQAHLLQIGSQKFLVTTDRSGVKTVNPINAWDDLDTPVAEVSDAAIAA